MNFIQKLLKGQVRTAQIDDYVERWHNSGSSASLPKFLGMTAKEYERWVENPRQLSQIVAARVRRTHVTAKTRRKLVAARAKTGHRKRDHKVAA
jgi:hypothetical protein